MYSVPINSKDVLKSIYFILSIAQNQKGNAMHGALTSKGDLIGGIFDRWINIVPEDIIFNKILLPLISQEKNVKLISDFYHYDPKNAGIAPDVIGLKINDKTVPFAIFDDTWVAVENMPQIEVKTFKTPQKMISLRDQGYANKYLIMTETNLRLDYLLPFFDMTIFPKEIHDMLSMDDTIFIKSDKEGLLKHVPQIDFSKKELGFVNLLKITNADEFMKIATFCEAHVSVQYIKSIEEHIKKKNTFNSAEKLAKFCTKNSYGLFSFNQDWYDGLNDNKIPYIKKGNVNFLQRALDFYTDNIDAISIVKRNKNNIYIEVSSLCTFNGITLEPEKRYKVEFDTLARNDNNGEEYFMQKSLIEHIPSLEEELIKKLKKIVDEN